MAHSVIVDVEVQTDAGQGKADSGTVSRAGDGSAGLVADCRQSDCYLMLTSKGVWDFCYSFSRRGSCPNTAASSGLPQQKICAYVC